MVDALVIGASRITDARPDERVNATNATAAKVAALPSDFIQA